MPNAHTYISNHFISYNEPLSRGNKFKKEIEKPIADLDAPTPKTIGHILSKIICFVKNPSLTEKLKLKKLR
jgi:hypothetical protein